ncbi:hypothetical protein [Bradyrhizobium sp. USDA 10063]
MMDVESEISDLKARLQATETVHALLIGICARLLTGNARISPEELLGGVRESISASYTGSDPLVVERVQLLSEQ